MGNTLDQIRKTLMARTQPQLPSQATAGGGVGLPGKGRAPKMKTLGGSDDDYDTGLDDE